MGSELKARLFLPDKPADIVVTGASTGGGVNTLPTHIGDWYR